MLPKNETHKDSVPEIFWSIIEKEKGIILKNVKLSSNDRNFYMGVDMILFSNETMQITSDNVDEFVLTRITIMITHGPQI